MTMVYEKSCGFVVYKNQEGMRTYLIIRASNGEYGFPKGHVEGHETEHETAIRELKEETNLEVHVIDGFRRPIEYQFPTKTNVMKQSVYFLGRCMDANIVWRENEIREAKFVSLETALSLLSFDETKEILKDADTYLCSISAM